MEMYAITTKAGARVRVEVGTPAVEIEIIKAAEPVEFREFCYTGNSANGTNDGNYDDMEKWLKAAGLEIIEDDLTMIIYNLEKISGVAELTHRGKRLRYHVQSRQGDSNNFGYTWRAEYRLISCEPVERRGGSRPGAGRPPATPGASIAAALDRLETAIGAAQERREIGYAEAEALFRRLDSLSQAMEIVIVGTADHPDPSREE